jgi:uncharacterized protein (DUF952 family)
MTTTQPSIIYHISTPAAWDVGKAAGHYEAPSLATEGFIHCSTASQVLRVANSIYKGVSGLILLHLDSEKLSSRLQYDPPAHPAGKNRPHVQDGELFPHIYGPINPDAVVGTSPLEADADGVYRTPIEPTN